MKKLFICLSLLYLPICLLNSQALWFEADAKWTYEITPLFSAPGILKLEQANKDTIINNESYQQLHFQTVYRRVNNWLDTIIEQTQYVRQEGNKIYQYKEEKRKIYDFDLKVGDTLDFLYFNEASSFIFIVAAIDSIKIGNQNLAFQDISILTNSGTPFTVIRFIETLGAQSSFFFSEYTNLFIADTPDHFFRCYEDFNTPLVNLSEDQEDCDFIPISSGYPRLPLEGLSIYPNPGTHLLNVDIANTEVARLQLVDSQGKIVVSAKKLHLPLHRFDLSHLANGVYFLQVYDKQGRLMGAKKVLVNK